VRIIVLDERRREHGVDALRVDQLHLLGVEHKIEQRRKILFGAGSASNSGGTPRLMR